MHHLLCLGNSSLSGRLLTPEKWVELHTTTSMTCQGCSVLGKGWLALIGDRLP